MDIALLLALAMALVFAFSNGFIDAANAIATLVATRAARPLPAVLMASLFNFLGPIFFGAAVAGTFAKLVSIPSGDAVPVIGAALTGALTWNIVSWWRGIPSSSSQALVGGLVGATLLSAGAAAINWGGMAGLRPVGVLGVLITMALAPALAVLVAILVERLFLRAGRYLSRRAERPVRSAQWITSAGLAFSHGSNDTMKTVGIIVALLVAGGYSTGDVPGWAVVLTALALTIGTLCGGWAIVSTIGKRIFPLRQLDGLASQAVSATIVLAASGLGAPVSTTQVVSATIIGIGGGRRRWSHVNWAIVKDISLTWLTTMPAAAALAAIALPVWRLLP